MSVKHAALSGNFQLGLNEVAFHLDRQKNQQVLLLSVCKQ